MRGAVGAVAVGVAAAVSAACATGGRSPAVARHCPVSTHEDAVGCVERGAFGEVEARYPSGQLRARGRYVHGRAEGAWETWHDNGQQWRVGAYVGGRETGRWTEYHATGAMMFEGSFVDGRLDGPWRTYFEDGRPAGEGTIERGRLIGKVTIHGRVDPWVSESTWVDNRPDGPITRTQDGVVRSQIEMRRGVAHGLYVVRGADGEPVLTVRYEDGRELLEAPAEPQTETETRPQTESDGAETDAGGGSDAP